MEWQPLGRRVLDKVRALLTGNSVPAAGEAASQPGLGLESALGRCGLEEVRPVASHEGSFWVAASASGDSSFLTCPACCYAAAPDFAPCPAPVPAGRTGPGVPPVEKRPTPGVHTVAGLAAVSGVSAERQIKILICETDPPGDLVAVLVRGDRTLSPRKVASVLGVRGATLGDRDEILRRTGAPIGSAGPVGLRGARLVADGEVMALADTACGANEEGHHLFHVWPGRDFVPELVGDFRAALVGDPCPECGQPLEAGRGITVARPGPGGPEPDVEAVVAAVVEAHRDGVGIVWSAALAPFAAVVVPVNILDAAQREAAEAVAASLAASGLDVLLDDRDLRPGPKFADADLIGFPLQVIIGPRGLAEGQAEVVQRSKRTRTTVPLNEVGAALPPLLGR